MISCNAAFIRPMSSFQQAITSTIKENGDKVLMVAMIIFASLTAIYFAIKYYSLKGNLQVPFLTPKALKNEDKTDASEGGKDIKPVGAAEEPSDAKGDETKIEKEPVVIEKKKTEASPKVIKDPVVVPHPALRIGTYNVLHPYPAHNNFHYLPSFGKDWASRVHIIERNILESDAHLLMIQEISIENFKDLKTRLPQYNGFHTKHDALGGPAKPDGVAIFYRQDRLNLKAVRTIYPTLRTTTARRDLFVDVEDQVTKKTFRCAAAHIEGGPDRSIGNTQLQEIIHYIDTSSAYPIDGTVLGADLNEEQSKTRFAILKSSGYATTDENDMQESEVLHNRQIDWIFYKAHNPDVQLRQKCTVHNQQLGSDHRLVTVEIECKSHTQIAP